MATSEGSAFNISVVGDVTGTTWAGDFRAKERLSFGDQIAIDRKRRELLGPNAQGADVEIIAQAQMLSELSVRLIEQPAWWRELKGGLDLADSNVLIEIYQKAIDIQREAIARVQKAGEDARLALRDIRKADEQK